MDKKEDRRKEQISFRRSCEAEGTGLSHFVMPNKDKPPGGEDLRALRKRCDPEGTGLSHYISTQLSNPPSKRRSKDNTIEERG